MTEGAGITASAAKSLTVLAYGVAQTTPGRSNVERPDLHLTNNDILAISGSLTANRTYCPAGFSAAFAAGFFVSAVDIFGFQKSGSALIQSSDA
jgi:hypothetical protein